MSILSHNDILIEEFLQDTNYYIGIDWNVYTNRPKSGPIGKKTYPWRNIVRVNENGYHYFTYKGKWLKLHRVIFRFYYGYITDHPINHKDGNKSNNSPNNLELSCHAKNMEHAKKHGMILKGEKHPNATLTDDLVIQIKQLLKSGKMIVDICRQFGISEHAVSQINRNLTWTHINV